MIGPGATRLFALCGLYAAGVVAAEVLRPGARAVVLVAAVASGLTMLRPRALPVFAIGLGLCVAGLRLASLEGAALTAGAGRGADAVLTGEVLSDARAHLDASRFAMRVEHAVLDGVERRVRERAWVTVRPIPAEPLETGALVRVAGRLTPVRFPDMDAVGTASARRLEHRGIAARAFASPSDVEVLGRSTNPVVRVADAGRAAVRRAAARLPERRRGLLLGVTIGDVSLLPKDVEADFRTTGLSHLVAVSGANVAMVLAVVALSLRAARAGRGTAVAVMVMTVFAFMAITRFEPSVTRAGTMACVALTGLAIGARRSATSALGAAALVLLVHDPFTIFNAGFQLSALATLGILVVSPAVARALPKGALGLMLSVTIGAQLAVAPLLIVHFHQVSIISIVANLMVEPAVAPATIIGMLAAGAGALLPAGEALAFVAAPFIAWMQAIAAWLAHLPWASVGAPAGPVGGALALLVGVATVAFVRGWRPRRLGPIVLAVALAMTGGVWARAIEQQPALAGLVVEMIDVGQGEAILVRVDGRAMLIDGGPDPQLIVQALRARGIRRLDLLVATHPHQDHVAGLAAAAASVTVGGVLDPFIDDDLPAYVEMVQALEARGIPRTRAIAGSTFAMGLASVEVLWPPEEHLVATGSDLNNNSVVLRVAYGSDAVLFAGETEEAAQQELLAGGVDLRARVLKVSHHGSARMVPDFYAATGAEVALIPVGPNTFGHPAPATLVALRAMTVLRSDLHGDVAVALDGSGGLSTRIQRGSPDMSASFRTVASSERLETRYAW